MTVYRPLISNAGQSTELTDANFIWLPNQAIAENAASPNPGTTNSLVFSTTTGLVMRWTGSLWTSAGINDLKVSGLTAQTAGASGLALADLLATVDVSDTTMASSGTDKKISNTDFAAGMRYLLSNVSTARVINASGAADTYLTGSNIAIPSGYPIVGTTYRCRFDVTKTAAGTATPIIIVRVGTAGSTADAAINTFTFSAGTAATDAGVFDVEVSFRTVGSGTSAVLVGDCRLNGQPTTGLSLLRKAAVSVSSGFNSTTANLIIGASYNGGTSAVHTVERCRSELLL